MSHLRTITSFGGKKLKDGRKTDYTTPQILKSKNNSLYIVLVFGAVSSHGELLDSTIRFWFADRQQLEAVVVGCTKIVEPIEQD